MTERAIQAAAVAPAVALAVAPAADQRIAEVFARCFARGENCLLCGGADEPLYQPASGEQANTIFYRDDFARSALHEVAHWCIAGEQRRKLLDYGYWYEPDGRSAEQQQQFELVERKPQALEWFFCLASGLPFALSIDNLDAAPGDNFSFALAVWQQARRYLREGLPGRAASFQQALAIEFGGIAAPSDRDLSLAALWR